MSSGSSRHSITTLLQRWNAGDQRATEELLPLVYDHLRSRARRQLGAGYQTLQPTILAHDAYLRLVSQGGPPWHGQAHFFAVADRVMQRVVLDYKRYRHRQKRGGGWVRLPLQEHGDRASGPGNRSLALREALQRLRTLDPETAKLVELRFFAGLSIDETARVLGLSASSVVRRWRHARSWLRRTLDSHGS